jgi:hypothetical protein
MKTLSIVASGTFFACNLVGLAQSAVPCGQTLASPLRPNATLSIHSIAAGIEIVGTDQNTVRVSCSAEDMDSARQVQLQLTGAPTGAKLTLTGPHLKHGNLAVRIEVPRKTNLGLEMAAGDVKVAGVVGDKDLTLRAGAITISSVHASNYKDIDASVAIGQVNISPDGETKGGFFRDFRKQNPDGEYRLHAHVTTGNIVLIGMSKQDTGARGDGYAGSGVGTRFRFAR